MDVKGILIQGTDGQEYLLGFGQRPTGRTKGPTLSRRSADGSFEPLEQSREASKVARERLGLAASDLLKPGWGKDTYLNFAFDEAMRSFRRRRST